MPVHRGSRIPSLGWSQRLFLTCETPSDPNHSGQPNRRRIGFLMASWYNPRRGELMANLAGVVQQLRKERDQAARQSNVSTQHSPRSMAVRTGKGRAPGAGCQPQEGRGSRLPREHDGQRCGGMPDRNKTSSACQKEDDVSRRSKENCRSTTSEMGEGEGCSKEDSVRRHLGSQWESSHRQSETAIARRSPTRPPPTVVVVATGVMRTVPSLPPSCRCLVRQPALHRAPTLLSPSAC